MDPRSGSKMYAVWPIYSRRGGVEYEVSLLTFQNPGIRVSRASSRGHEFVISTPWLRVTMYERHP